MRFLVFLLVIQMVLAGCSQNGSFHVSQSVVPTDVTITPRNPMVIQPRGEKATPHVLGFLEITDAVLEKDSERQAELNFQALVSLKTSQSSTRWSSKVSLRGALNVDGSAVLYPVNGDVAGDLPVRARVTCLSDANPMDCDQAIIDIFVKEGDKTHAAQVLAEMRKNVPPESFAPKKEEATEDSEEVLPPTSSGPKRRYDNGRAARAKRAAEEKRKQEELLQQRMNPELPPADEATAELLRKKYAEQQAEKEKREADLRARMTPEPVTPKTPAQKALEEALKKKYAGHHTTPKTGRLPRATPNADDGVKTTPKTSRLPRVTPKVDPKPKVVETAPGKEAGKTPDKAPVKTPVEDKPAVVETTPDKTPVKVPEKGSGKTPDKAPVKTPTEEKPAVVETAPGKVPAKVPEKDAGKTPDKAPVKTPTEEKPAVVETAPGKVPAKAPEKDAGKTPDKAPVKTPTEEKPAVVKTTPEKAAPVPEVKPKQEEAPADQDEDEEGDEEEGVDPTEKPSLFIGTLHEPSDDLFKSDRPSEEPKKDIPLPIPKPDQKGDGKKEDPKKDPPVVTPTPPKTSGGNRPRDQVIGLANKGSLQNASNMTKKSEASGFVVMRPGRNRHFGSYELVEVIEYLAKFAKSRGSIGTLQVGDLSQQSGGKLQNSKHKSHQNGLDVDLGYPMTGNQTPFTNLVSGGKVSSVLKVNETWAMMKAAWATKTVDRVFMDVKIKQALCQVAKKTGELDANGKGSAVELLRRIRPTPGHGTHFHLRIRCSTDQPRCRMIGDPPFGSGC